MNTLPVSRSRRAFRSLPPVPATTVPVTVLPPGYTRAIPPTTRGRLRARGFALYTAAPARDKIMRHIPIVVPPYHTA